MAGGSQIVISDDGITISTGGKILYQAGQHKFESGKKVVSPVTVLPTPPKDYSRKFLIPNSIESEDSNIRVGKPTRILGLSESDNKPIFLEEIKSNSSEDVIETKRFYAPQPTNAIVHLFVDLPVMNIHESDDEDSTEEEIND